MGFTQKLVQRIPVLVFILGLAAFGLGRRASRTSVGSQVPDILGILLIIAAIVLWYVINIIVGVGK